VTIKILTLLPVRNRKDRRKLFSSASVEMWLQLCLLLIPFLHSAKTNIYVSEFS